MANIMDYIDWRGDLTFESSPLNEVDMYAISKIGTQDFTGIVPGTSEKVSIGEASDAYCKKYGKAGDYLGALTSDSIAPMVRRLPETERFRGLMLSEFVSRIIEEKTEQFSALTVSLPNGQCIVTFRGTDDTLLAWKENMLMSVESSIAAQRDALEYLKKVMSDYDGRIIVAGHSKGGNLAVYAAATAPIELQERISAVYSFDGPGFREVFFYEPGYIRIRPKVNFLLPCHSIVGVLLSQDTNMQIIKSNRAGIAGHDGFTWEVMGSSFVRSDSLSRGSQSFDEVMNAVMRGLSFDDRRALIEDLFDAFSEVGAVTLTDMTEHRMRRAIRVVASLSRSAEVKKLLTIAIEQMMREFRQYP